MPFEKIERQDGGEQNTKKTEVNDLPDDPMGGKKADLPADSLEDKEVNDLSAAPLADGEPGELPEDGLADEKADDLPEDELSGKEGTDLPEDPLINEKMDDNGKLYRIGNDLIPNNSYEINGYRYQTDVLGRIKSVIGVLRIKDRVGRLPIKDSIEVIGKGDQLETDDRGHLIGDQFDGSNGLENMIPQDANINRKDYKNFENELAREINNGNTVKVEIQLSYPEGSRRPDAIIVKYSINGVQNIRIFPNNPDT